MDDWGFDDVEEDIDINDGSKNLNKLNDEELQKYKDAMDVQF